MKEPSPIGPYQKKKKKHPINKIDPKGSKKAHKINSKNKNMRQSNYFLLPMKSKPWMGKGMVGSNDPFIFY